MIGLQERIKIAMLRKQGYPIRKVAQLVKEEFWLQTLSPTTVLNIMKEEWFTDAQEGVNEEVIDEKIITQLATSWSRTYNKKAQEALKYKATADKLIADFIKALKEVWLKQDSTPITIKELSTVEEELRLLCGDFHYWRTTETVKDNFSALINTAIHSWCNKINLVLMWDLIESPIVTWMHDWQVLDMDVFGIKQALWCIDMIAGGIKFLLWNNKQVEIFWLNGNHVRMSKSRDWDPERIVGSMMYETLKYIFPDIPITYSPDWILTKETEYCNFILAHGDNWFNQKPDAQIMASLWVYGKLNIIASGHWHTSQMTQGNWYVRLQIPSINTQSEYEKHKFISKSRPWYVLLEERKWNPLITFTPL